MIDANTLINSLIHFTNIVQEVNKELSGDKKVEVKIKASKEGSYIVDLVIASTNIIDHVTTFFSRDNIEYAANIVEVVVGVYGAAKFLRGKKPKRIENTGDNNVTVENNTGEITVLDLRGATIYINNPVV